jgi:phosphoglycolate phosphatase
VPTLRQRGAVLAQTSEWLSILFPLCRVVASTSPPTIFFDLDGTLMDPQVGILACIRHALEALAVPSPDTDTLRQWIGPPLEASFTQLLRSPDQAQQAVALYRQRFATVGLYENTVYPAIPDLLHQLQTRGFPLYVVTAKPQVFAEKIVTHFHLAPYFQAIYGSQLDGTHAHKQDLIAHVLEELALPGTAAVMVGDRHHDIQGAKANGLATIGVLWGYGSRVELQGAGADCLCDRPADLLDRLLQVQSS